MLIVAIGYAFKYFHLEAPNAPLPAHLEGPFTVATVIDGDTIWIEDANQQIEKIRLIGINTPEKNERYYQSASDYTAQLIANQSVYLERGEGLYDKYHRSLCYVYLEDQSTMLNEAILAAGWAKIMTIKPNDKYEQKFIKILDEAIKENKGLYQ